MAFLTLYLVLAENVAAFAVSLLALLATLSFCSDTMQTTLPLAPKATAELHKVLIPPMRNM